MAFMTKTGNTKSAMEETQKAQNYQYFSLRLLCWSCAFFVSKVLIWRCADKKLALAKPI
jgi:hypothetical protein